MLDPRERLLAAPAAAGYRSRSAAGYRSDQIVCWHISTSDSTVRWSMTPLLIWLRPRPTTTQPLQPHLTDLSADSAASLEFDTDPSNLADSSAGYRSSPLAPTPTATLFLSPLGKCFHSLIDSDGFYGALCELGRLEDCCGCRGRWSVFSSNLPKTDVAPWCY